MCLVPTKPRLSVGEVISGGQRLILMEEVLLPGGGGLFYHRSPKKHLLHSGSDFPPSSASVCATEYVRNSDTL